MNELVILKHDDVFTTSEVIAEGCNVKHNSITRILRNYPEDFEELGALGFEIQVLKLTNNKGSTTKKIYLLNEQQTTLLMTYLRNTPVVREFKKALVREFYEMRKFIMERHTEEWIESRKLSKLNRRAETDTLKELVEYAQANGSKNATRYYSAYSKLANKVVGITNRDEAHIPQLNTLSVVESIIKSTVHEGIAQGMDYHDIYKVCKEKLLVFSDTSYTLDDYPQ